MNRLHSAIAAFVLGSLPITENIVPTEERADYTYLYRTDSGKVYASGQVSWEIKRLESGSFQLARRSDTEKYQLTVLLDTLRASFLPAGLTARMAFQGGGAEYRIGYSKRPLSVYSTSPHGVMDTSVDAPRELYDYSQLEFLPRYFGLKPGTKADFVVFQLDIPNGTTRLYQVHSEVEGMETQEINGRGYRCYRVKLMVQNAAATAWYSVTPEHRLVRFWGKNPLRLADTTELTLRE